MNDKIDLHTHTTASDGIFSPLELIEHAKKNNVLTLAITDHDTIDGLAEGCAYARECNYNLIPGIEFSTVFENIPLHLVGLYIDDKNSQLIDAVNRLKQERKKRIHEIIEDLNKHNIDISFSEIDQDPDQVAVGKPHIARLLIKKGYADDMDEVFKKFMLRGKPGFTKKRRIFFHEAIELIKISGGISFVAHPVSMRLGSFSEYLEIFKELIVLGLDGIEVFASMHSVEEVGLFQQIADKYNLVVSGGSDFHGDKNEELGFYLPGRKIPYQLAGQVLKYVNSIDR